ncbi:MAG: Tar ligand binding domain-containing protein, partial [Alcaligenes sp.]
MLGIESSLPSASRASKRRSSKSFRPSLKSASGLKISTMLMICMAFFLVLIVAVGGLAAYFLQQSGDALRTINRQDQRAMQILQLNNNMMEARVSLMSAARFYQEAGIDNDANMLQSADNLVIMANQKLDEVRKAFADIRANMPTEPELRRLAMGLVASYQAYLDDGIEPMVQALETRDYSTFYFVSEGFGVLRAATFQFRIEELSKF